jgi:hypothetical protein
MAKPEDYATHIATMMRAGVGGEMDHFLMSAGAPSATMNGLGFQFSKRESRAAILLVKDLMPISKMHSKTTQSEGYSRSQSKRSYDTMVAKFTKAIVSPEEGRPLSHNWEADAIKVTATGTTMKRTAKRGKAYIEKMCKSTAASMLQAHIDRRSPDDIADDLLGIFNFVNGLQLWPQVSNASLDQLYAPFLDKIVAHFCVVPEGCVGQKPLFEEDAVRDEWDSFRTHYIEAAKGAHKHVLAAKNKRSKEEIDAKNKLSRTAKAVKFTPSNQLDVEEMLQHLLGMTNVFRRFPISKFLAETLQTSLYSQARLEGMFRTLKLTCTPLRNCLKGDKVDMLMCVKQNGPNSVAGKKTIRLDA